MERVKRRQHGRAVVPVPGELRCARPGANTCAGTRVIPSALRCWSQLCGSISPQRASAQPLVPCEGLRASLGLAAAGSAHGAALGPGELPPFASLLCCSAPALSPQLGLLGQTLWLHRQGQHRTGSDGKDFPSSR